MGALLVFLVDVGYCVMVVVGQKGLVECELYKMVVWTLVMPVPGLGLTCMDLLEGICPYVRLIC